MLIARPIKDRIEANSIPEPNSGCWIWLGSIDHWGYGQIRICRADRQALGLKGTQAAHRMAWLCYRGSIPDSLCVLHSCDNTVCVNPDHLWLGTLKDNSRDMVTKGRHRSSHDRRPLSYANVIHTLIAAAVFAGAFALATDYRQRPAVIITDAFHQLPSAPAHGSLCLPTSVNIEDRRDPIALILGNS